MDNVTNGAETVYEFVFNSNTDVQTGDLIRFEFPPEIGLPHNASIDCWTKQNFIREIECTRSNEYEISILLKKMFTLDSDDTFDVHIPHITNAFTTRPSSSFTNF